MGDNVLSFRAVLLLLLTCFGLLAGLLLSEMKCIVILHCLKSAFMKFQIFYGISIMFH